MVKKKFLFCILISICYSLSSTAQYVYGTTGLLHMPTAEMQKDKTFLFGASYLDVNATPKHWSYDTYNYYINITFFPWLEIGYVCTLHKLGLPKYGYSYKFRNQDRQFSVRFRAWKEGWWKSWTPQIVIGANDPGTNDIVGNPNKDDYGYTSASTVGNGHWNRYYIALTKHFDIINTGQLGVHAAYVYNKRIDYHLNGLAIGANFKFCIPRTSFMTNALNGINLMAEYDSRTINFGIGYSFWKDYITAVVEMTDCQYLSGGLIFKVFLK